MKGHAYDVGRLVIQCGCSRAARWAGEETARLQGWRSRWIERRGREVRVWTCADCYLEEVSRRAPERLVMPDFLRRLMLGGKVALVEEQLALVRGDGPRFDAWLQGVRATLPALSKKARKHWTAFVDLQLLGPASAAQARQPSRRPPATRRRPAPARTATAPSGP